MNLPWRMNVLTTILSLQCNKLRCRVERLATSGGRWSSAITAVAACLGFPYACLVDGDISAIELHFISSMFPCNAELQSSIGYWLIL